MKIQLNSQAAYTLIEILIVLFIMSIVTGAAVLTISHNESRRLEQVANEVAQLITLAEEQAMLQPTILGFSVNKHALQFFSYQAPGEKAEQQWVAVEDDLLTKTHFPADIQFTSTMTPDKENNTPQIIISSNGTLTPFTIYIGKHKQKPLFVVSGEADGYVAVKSLS